MLGATHRTATHRTATHRTGNRRSGSDSEPPVRWLAPVLPALPDRLCRTRLASPAPRYGPRARGPVTGPVTGPAPGARATGPALDTWRWARPPPTEGRAGDRGGPWRPARRHARRRGSTADPPPARSARGPGRSGAGTR